jgi:hypothetical protein
MINLVKAKIEECSYSDNTSIAELHKLLNISKHVIWDASRNCTPPYQEYGAAIAELNKLSKIPGRTFSEMKEKMLSIFDILANFILNNEAHKSTTMDLLFFGQGAITQMNRIEFSLLMVEQNNLDFFKERPSHLPSQPHDRLLSHYIIYTGDGRINIKFLDGTEVPLYIQEQVLKAFKDAGEEPK